MREIGRNQAFTHVLAEGSSCGILLAQLSCPIQIKVIASRHRVIHVLLNMNKFKSWIFSIFYASMNNHAHNRMWNDQAETGRDNIPWLICGDFNYIFNLEDKREGSPFSLTPLYFQLQKFYLLLEPQ